MEKSEKKASSESLTSSPASNLEYWMTNLPQKLRTIPLIHLAIPGSHDSTTYSITAASKVAPDAEPLVQRLKFLGPVLRNIMSHWSRTQAAPIGLQLANGVRYFDLRVSTNKPADNRFYFVHGLYGAQVDAVFAEIKRFLDAHPNEVLILDLQHFYAFHPADHDNLMLLLGNTFGHKLVPYTPRMEHLSLEYMTSQFRYQVIVIYRSDAARFGQPLLWPSSYFPTPWPNTLSKTRLIQFLNRGLKMKNNKIAFVSQFVLTPTTWFVCRNIFSSLKKQCAQPIAKDKFHWLSRQKPGRGGVNIIISDFVDDKDFMFAKDIVELNWKLMEQITVLTPIDDN